YLADSQNQLIQLNRLTNILAELWDDHLLKSLDINTWDSIINYIVKLLPPKKKFVLVIDEFQYLAKVNKSLQK
ncbi:MAG: ATP-binding protein, partial [bacterium]|nr:ATP-binding protein [bacterium]